MEEPPQCRHRLSVFLVDPPSRAVDVVDRGRSAVSLYMERIRTVAYSSDSVARLGASARR